MWVLCGPSHVVTPRANGDSGTSREQRIGKTAAHRTARTMRSSGAQMMFLDCPAYLDQEGAVRCGLPAEVRSRFTMRSTDGPLETGMIQVPSGTWVKRPYGPPPREKQQPQGPGPPRGCRQRREREPQRQPERPPPLLSGPAPPALNPRHDPAAQARGIRCRDG